MGIVSRRSDAVLIGRALLAGVAGVVGSYAAAGSTPRFVASPIESWLTALMPDVVVRFAITVLTPLGEPLGVEHLGQALNLALALGLATGLFASLAAAALVTGRVRDDSLVAIGFATVLVWIATAVLTTDLVSALGAGLACGAVVALGTLSAGESTDDAGRRALLGSLAGALVVGLSGYALGRRRTAAGTATSETPASPADGAIEERLAEADRRSLSVSGLEGLVSESFYQVDINAIDPTVDSDGWTLSITGAVDRPVEYDYAGITSLRSDHRFVTLRCVSDPLDGNEMDTALWTGVSIADLLKRASPQGEHVVLRAADGYFQAFPLAALERGFLAYGMNGEPLPRAHGAPVRALIPGHWGEINVKWLTEVEVLDRSSEGYWEQRGWHGTGPVKTVAKLSATNRLADGRVEVAGHAYAGTRGVSAVQVSIDGDAWQDATVSEVLPASGLERERGLESAEDVWRQWRSVYEPPAGEHEVRVRAIEVDGTVQPRERDDPFPSGASGWVSRTIDGR